MVSIDGRIDLSQYALNPQQKSALSKARTADEVVQVLSQNGHLDQEEQKLLNEIMQELSQSSDQTLKLVNGSTEVNTVIFGNPADLQGRLEQKLNHTTLNRLRGSTSERSSYFSQIDNRRELSRILKGDQRLVDDFYSINRGAHVLNGKILLQDASLLGRFNLLAPAELHFIRLWINAITARASIT